MGSCGHRLTWDQAEARAALARYESVVRAVARRLSPVARFGHALDEDDLWAEGRIAVLEALRTYAGFGIEERTWVRTRVKQRMIDAIRRLDVRTREEVRRMSERARAAADQTAEPAPAPAVRRLVSLDATTYAEAELAQSGASESAVLADEAFEQNVQRTRLMRALSALPPRQREAIELGLFEGLPLREIGGRMGISESRVCQLQKRAVQHLQKVISEVELDAA